MRGLERGLYEQLITRELEARLREVDAARLMAERGALSPAEAPDRLALHLARLIRRVVASLPDKERVARGMELARQLVRLIHGDLGDGRRLDVLGAAPAAENELLRALLARRPDGEPETLTEPLTPLLDTTLLTNSPGEPRIGSQVSTEISSADRIDVVMAFIRRTGIRQMLEGLRAHCAAGRPLRVLTTTYTNSTEAAALEQLRELGADIKVSYDTSGTRLHAKAWLFHRGTGFSTAYIGSSNLTWSAQVTGMEWNVRVSGARNPDVIEKFSAVFESYWNHADFEPYDPAQFLERTARAERDDVQIVLSPLELEPRPFQERLLEQIELARQSGHHRNLLVAATGTGKTVMAAVDYARLRQRLPRARLLFVAHRKEILDQSLATFRQALRDHAFGERWVGGERPRRFEHVFASIQSLSAARLDDLDPAHFDVVIVDEFHHAAAPTYTALLDHLQPKELLGLTATPERADGMPVIHWFDDRIAAELRLWDAIDQQRLTPFLYYGIHDGTDLRQVTWRRGRGYDVEGLSNVLTADDGLARFVLDQLRDHAEDLQACRALGFCVSVEHARFMARVFRAAGMPATAVWGDTPRGEREAALRDLAEGRVRVLFSVDLFNEGVDVPTVDTLLLLRPTDSATLFIQQLGRGLRKSPGKTACTVLDFVGQHRKEFRFDRRMRALLGGTRKHLMEQVEASFPLLPAGCHMELDAVASEIVLSNLRDAVPSKWAAKAAELQRFAAETEGDVQLGEYLDASGLELDGLYDRQGRGWSDLRQAAGLSVREPGPDEAVLRRACGRLRHVDDRVRLETYRRLLRIREPPKVAGLREHDRRLLRMLVASATGQAVTKDTSLEDGIRLLWDHPQVAYELIELFHLLEARVDHVHAPLETHPDVPLQVHARYTRVEILAAFGEGEGAKTASWMTGVHWAKNAKTDLFAFTLDKTTGHFSPTTRYNDYAISRELIHWESQSATRADSTTGRRYQDHVAMGTSVMLFARLDTSDKAFWFLGPATYVSHESEQPMKVVWRLKHRLPGDLFAAFAAAVA